MSRLLVILSCLIFSTLALAQNPRPFKTTLVTEMDAPWAIEFLPDGRMLITEKAGRLLVVNRDGKKSAPVSGVPAVDVSMQGGMHDVMLHPDFENNKVVYLTYVEPGENGTRGGVMGRGRLNLTANGGSLSDFRILWRQSYKYEGQGHFSLRMKFSPDGKYLFLTSGERQQGDPAQDLSNNLGKVLRLNEDGSIPSDNPFADKGGDGAAIWSYGHRNLLGLAFDNEGNLWQQEMGPSGGDELNLIEKGANYGWPIVSNGEQYNGDPIPHHDTHPEFKKPVVYWHPSISPGGLLAYDGNKFPDWKGHFFIGGLGSQSLVRVGPRFGAPSELERYDMGARIRDVEQGPDGYIWLLMDPDRDGKWKGGLLKLTPVTES